MKKMILIGALMDYLNIVQLQFLQMAVCQVLIAKECFLEELRNFKIEKAHLILLFVEEKQLDWKNMGI